jgi:hypothetical protein
MVHVNMLICGICIITSNITLSSIDQLLSDRNYKQVVMIELNIWLLSMVMIIMSDDIIYSHDDLRRPRSSPAVTNTDNNNRTISSSSRPLIDDDSIVTENDNRSPSMHRHHRAPTAMVVPIVSTEMKKKRTTPKPVSSINRHQSTTHRYSDRQYFPWNDNDDDRNPSDHCELCRLSRYYNRRSASTLDDARRTTECACVEKFARQHGQIENRII